MVNAKMELAMSLFGISHQHFSSGRVDRTSG